MARNRDPEPTDQGSRTSVDLNRALDYVRALRQKYPGLWDTLDEGTRQQILRQAERALERGDRFPKFFKGVSGLDPIVTWFESQGEESPGTDPPPPTEGGEDEEETPPPADPEPTIDTDVRDLLANFLTENELPGSLLGFITDSLAQKKSYAQIIAELRQTPEYLAAYPENAIRQEQGFSWMPEAEIRATRDELKRLAFEYLGVADVTQDELNAWIGEGKSVRLFEQKLQRYQEFERWGPTVQAVLESELGYSIDDERLFAFFDDTPTPELDHAYENALMRAQPALLGLGVRPEDEAEILRRYGINPTQAFAGYQNLARELPRAERLGLIEAEIGRNVESFPTGTELFADTPFATLFRAIQLNDADAIRTLQGQLAREVARFQGSGGAAQTQQGSVGLLERDERELL